MEALRTTIGDGQLCSIFVGPMMSESPRALGRLSAVWRLGRRCWQWCSGLLWHRALRSGLDLECCECVLQVLHEARDDRLPLQQKGTDVVVHPCADVWRRRGTNAGLQRRSCVCGAHLFDSMMSAVGIWCCGCGRLKGGGGPWSPLRASMPTERGAGCVTRGEGTV